MEKQSITVYSTSNEHSQRLKTFIANYIKILNRYVNIKIQEITDRNNYNVLKAALEKQKYNLTNLPIVIYKGHIYSGDSADVPFTRIIEANTQERINTLDDIDSYQHKIIAPDDDDDDDDDTSSPKKIQEALSKFNSRRQSRVSDQPVTKSRKNVQFKNDDDFVEQSGQQHESSGTDYYSEDSPELMFSNLMNEEADRMGRKPPAKFKSKRK